MDLSILYRGPLSSCNYGCEYCPFAKGAETVAQLAGDRAALSRFTEWVTAQGPRGHRMSILFTPWGEALVRPWYQDALATLTNLPHVAKSAIQTNISCRLDWVDRCDKSRLALWCTYHPGETTRARFLARCRELDDLGVRYSVGIVGMREHMLEIEALRRELAPQRYVWVNAYKRVENYYSGEDLQRLEAVDPLFPVNNVRHASEGLACRAGETVIAVDGEGTIRRCHFIKEPIGNIYADGWEAALQPRLCANATCGCHIGYVHMPHLGLYDVFEDGVLERVPRMTRLPLKILANQVSISG